jgi:hypothetical protein
MLVVSLALAAVLLAGSGGSDDGSTDIAASERTPLVATATRTPAPTTTPAPTPLPPLAFELQERLNALPEKLQNETLHAYVTGTLTIEQLEQIVTQYENRNPAVRVGTVLGVAEGVLRFEVFTTGEQAEVASGEHTLIRRAGEDIALADLQPGELVMVVSTDGGAIAVTIEAFGVAAP